MKEQRKLNMSMSSLSYKGWTIADIVSAIIPQHFHTCQWSPTASICHFLSEGFLWLQTRV